MHYAMHCVMHYVMQALRGYLTQKGLNRMTEQEVESFVTGADANGDGRIQYEEFIAANRARLVHGLCTAAHAWLVHSCAWRVRGMCVACAWHVHGTCMACTWHIQGMVHGMVHGMVLGMMHAVLHAVLHGMMHCMYIAWCIA